MELARHHGLDLGAGDEDEIVRRARVMEPMGDLQEVLDSFRINQQVLCSYDAIRRVTEENVEDAARENIRLVELRFAPAFIAAEKEIKYDEIMEGVLDGVHRGMEAHQVQVGLICILPRTYPIEANRGVTEELLRYASGSHRCADRLCGLDLADAEKDVDTEPLAELVRDATEAGLGITVHTGENTSADHVKRSLEVYSPRRIGHGIRSWGDRECIDSLRKNEIHLEVCPTSNVRTNSVASYKEHPLPLLRDAGVSVSVNSDDPHLFAIDLTHELEICMRFYGWGIDDLRALTSEALHHSFVNSDVKKFVARRLLID